ncbi:hypothetical protein BJV78DRAFT_1153837 [Lactifluus subvellereus]|nr:hypothetical protein BJV78DRAFT_1153837 [Lactifluus subvellereus]
MSNRNALNKELIMRRVVGHYQTQTPSSGSTMTDSDSTSRLPHENGVQTSLYPDGLAHLETEPTEFRSSIRTPTARSAAISSMDEKIEAARHHILSLLTRRNALAPISLLPPELLARIFHFHAFEELQSNRETLSRIRVTHVCRYWRQVALEDCSLWARFSALPPSTTCLAEMLARAKGAPLIIDLDGSQNSKTFSMFSSHLSHIRELRLRNLCDSLVDGNSIRELCSLEAPMLEHFELGVPSFSPVIVQTSVGTRFFKGQAPKLRTFSLCQIQVPWSLVPRTQLSQLRIVLSKEISTTDDVSLLDTANQLIDVLTNNPALEDLVLQCCLPPMLSHASHSQAIHLPRLSHLGLAASSSRVADLLKVLKLPSSTKLHLRCTSENVGAYNDGLIPPLISAHFNKPDAITFKSLILTLDDMLIELTASSSLPISTVSRSHTFGCGLERDAELSLLLDADFNFGHLWDTLERVCAMLPIAEVEYLSISASDVLHPINWEGLFRRCEKITTIDVCGRGTTTLLQTLTPPKLGHSTSSGKGKKREDYRNAQAEGVDSTAPYVSPVFPELTTLLMRGLDFSDNVPRCGNLYDVLVNALRRRTLHKVPLKKLSINNSSISTKRSNALERLVQDFHCGKDEGFSWHDFDDVDSNPDLTDYEGYYGDQFVGTAHGEWVVDWEDYSDYSDEWF